MQWQRGGARIAMILTLAAGLVAVGSAPAMAADDSVEVRLPSRFTAGGSPATVSVSVEKRTDGCTRVQTALAFRLTGLPADQVTVEVSDDGEWRSVNVTDAGDGLVVTERTTPERSFLCKRRDTSVRYRVAFLEGAPGGRVTVVAEAYSAGGGLMDRDASARTVISRNGPSPSPSTSATAGGQAPAPGANGPSVAVAAPGGQSIDPDDSSFGLGTLVMLFGVAMVVLGIALLVFLLRRNRAEPDEPGGYGYPYLPPPSLPPPPPPARSFGGNGEQTLILPKVVD
ncbi:MAG TPA: hypothetical protein VHN18_17065 [Micromonosporaceae bacterium]|nr:hypothetical protein [Micromonosporaceae bacterium]